MKSLTLFLFLCIIQSGRLNARQVFITNGKIIFEKRVNRYKTLSDLNISDQAKDRMKKYRISNWELLFNRTKSLYKAEKNDRDDNEMMYFFAPGESENQLFANYSLETRILKKNIMGTDYLLKDTIPKIRWKIMHDARTIAGYECRKAIGVINDSVYVVAFYTDEILLRGGPEGFSGLPGMILGLAIPRYFTTWFATKVEAFTNHSAEIIPPDKGKKAENEKDLKKLTELLTSAFLL